ncbi:hypothetical protein GOP47_0014491 [Adiantum capillus-veneris]|uniref:Uncharacterized protein n=1 Tax=Adiantum capillus-veneris TaxID=13818 RepID=A0A9D4ZC74_ADICA|nr:hypothetical protein GOP47_0014491 [Adiantum capillus-veneris]
MISRPSSSCCSSSSSSSADFTRKLNAAASCGSALLLHRSLQHHHSAAALPASQLATSYSHPVRILCSAVGNARSVFESSAVAHPPPLERFSFGQAPPSTPPAPAAPEQVKQHVEHEMQDWIYQIKKMFQSMNLGEISISPYDTAWIGMVPSLDGSNSPQFPKCINWIINNQLLDGSWGDEKGVFLAYDRVSSTLACVIALKTWNIGHANVAKGVDFIHKNIHKFDEESDDYMPTAFEVVFPGMLDDAQRLGLDLPYDSPAVAKIRNEFKRKLNRIPMEHIHTHPTTLLHSLEGLHRFVDWSKILQFLTKDGSFLFSPAATACALKYTSDERCLNYINMVLQKFDNAAPSVYPVDLFEHLWMVDRLERLGVSRYFKKEIKDCLDYVYRYWTPRGIAWARDSNVFDADDTAMGFRLLRLHGYPVSPDVFNAFKRGKEFICFEGQTSQAVTGMHNLYRASQVKLPGETILEEIKDFTIAFLKEKRLNDTIQDKWVISNGLKDEVSYTLDFPWNQSLQRIEARNYMGHYGVDDAWIAKSLYKMPYVNNEIFLKLAKADYNLCQSFHQRELAQVLRWNIESKFDKLRFARQKPVECFFSVAATLFEPEYSFARIVWATSAVLTTIIDDFFDTQGSLEELTAFLNAVKSWDPTQAQGFSQDMRILFMGLYNTMNMINQEAYVAQGRDIIHFLRDTWVNFAESIYLEAKWRFSNHCPTLTEYINNAKDSIALKPIVQPTLFFLGEKLSQKDLVDEEYSHIMDLVNTIGRLNNDIQGFKRENREGKWSCISIFLKENPTASTDEAVEHFKKLSENTMSEFVEIFISKSRVSKQSKQLHLNMAKILNLFYSQTDGYTSLTAMEEHVKNTLFTPIP